MWCRFTIQNVSIITNVTIHGDSNDDVTDTNRVYALTEFNETLHIEFCECDRMIVNNMPICDATNTAVNVTFGTKNNLNVIEYTGPKDLNNIYVDLYRRINKHTNRDELIKKI